MPEEQNELLPKIDEVDDDDDLGITSTVALSKPPFAAADREAGAYLLVISDSSSTLHPLPASGTLVIGRDAGCDVILPHTSVSRQHAQLIIDGRRMTLVDLQSRNGVFVNGERMVRERALAPGDLVQLGALTLVLGATTTTTSSSPPLLQSSDLHARLALEVERALATARALCVGVVAAGAPLEGAWMQRLQATIRPLDLVGLLDDGRLAIVMPERSLDAATAQLRRLLAALGDPAARCGVACCSLDGAAAPALLAAASAAAMAALAGEVATATTPCRRLELGERVVFLGDLATIGLYQLIERLAKSALQIPVLITGETGVGKENAAYALHHYSSRRAHRFVALNCAGIPDSLVESELFGFDKGAFSGAVASKLGLLEAAHEGTLFLDEVGELTGSAQAKLLRVLETKRIMRLGSVREREVDVRIVAATNRDLRAEVSQGRFREDLYHRLAAATVALPPLRARPREITLLAGRFLEDACARARRPPLALSAATATALLRHRWPGNIRELKNVIEYAVATADGALVEPWHLPPGLDVAAETSDGGGEPIARFRPVGDELRELERRRMAEALAAADGVQTRAAQLIAMPMRTFATKLKQYGLTRSNGRRSD
jgi:DNA-binding NtrC family response regulator